MHLRCSLMVDLKLSVNQRFENWLLSCWLLLSIIKSHNWFYYCWGFYHPSEPLNSVCKLFDYNMSMFTHIGKACSRAFHGLYKILKMRKFLISESTKTDSRISVWYHIWTNATLFSLAFPSTRQIVLKIRSTLLLGLPLGSPSWITFRPHCFISTGFLWLIASTLSC